MPFSTNLDIGDHVKIGDDIIIVFQKRNGRRVILSISAPKNIKIDVYHEKDSESGEKASDNV